MNLQTRQNESVLVCAARQGDKDALRILLMRNWAWLKALVYSIVRDDDDVVLKDMVVVLGKAVGFITNVLQQLANRRKGS